MNTEIIPPPPTYHDTYTHIGCDFVDAHGARVTSVQLVDRKYGAIGICDWNGDTIVRFIVCRGVNIEQFSAEAKALRENSIPVTFQETKLP